MVSWSQQLTLQEQGKIEMKSITCFLSKAPKLQGKINIKSKILGTNHYQVAGEIPAPDTQPSSSWLWEEFLPWVVIPHI